MRGFILIILVSFPIHIIAKPSLGFTLLQLFDEKKAETVNDICLADDTISDIIYYVQIDGSPKHVYFGYTSGTLKNRYKSLCSGLPRMVRDDKQVSYVILKKKPSEIFPVIDGTDDAIWLAFEMLTKIENSCTYYLGKTNGKSTPWIGGDLKPKHCDLMSRNIRHGIYDKAIIMHNDRTHLRDINWEYWVKRVYEIYSPGNGDKIWWMHEWFNRVASGWQTKTDYRRFVKY